MPILNKKWMAVDGDSVTEHAGLLVECGGPYEPLTEAEFLAALRAVEAVRNGWIGAFDDDGEFIILGTRTVEADDEESTPAQEAA